MYNVLQEMTTEDPPVFATVNLNNIPYIDLKNVDGVSLLYKQSKLEDQFQEMLQQQAVMQSQLSEMSEYLKNSNRCGLRGGSSGPPLYSHVTKDDSRQQYDTSPNGGTREQQNTSTQPRMRSHLSQGPSLGDGLVELLHEQRVSTQLPSLPSQYTMEGVRRRAPVVNSDDDVRISSKFVKDSDGFIRRN